MMYQVYRSCGHKNLLSHARDKDFELKTRQKMLNSDSKKKGWRKPVKALLIINSSLEK